LGSCGTTGVEERVIDDILPSESGCGLLAVAIETKMVCPRGLSDYHDQQLFYRPLCDKGIAPNRPQHHGRIEVILFRIFNGTVDPVAGVGIEAQRLMLPNKRSIVLAKKIHRACHQPGREEQHERLADKSIFKVREGKIEKREERKEGREKTRDG